MFMINLRVLSYVLVVFFLAIKTCFGTVINNKDSSTILIQNVDIISMQTDELLAGKDLLISNGKIEKISVGIDPNSSTKVIDAEGQYIMPALFDMHAHIGVENPFLNYHLGLFRYFGVHHVNLMASNDEIVSVKQSVSGRFDDELKAPHLHLASELVDGDPPLWGEEHNGLILVDVEEVEPALLELKEKGYRDIKVYDQLSEDIYLKILDISKQVGLRVVGHVPSSLTHDNRLDARQQRIDHLYGFWELAYNGDISELPDMSMERIEILIDGFNEERFNSAAKQAAEKNIWVVPTHILYSALLDEQYIDEIMSGKYSQWLDPSLQSFWGTVVNDEEQMPHMRNEDFRTIHHKMITGLHEAGVRMMAGTDTPMPLLMYGRSLHKELELFTKAGLSPFEALQTATVHPAEYLELENSGIIAEGYKAELVLLDKNPLEDITNTLSITGYFTRNKYLNKTEMEKYLINMIE